MGETQIVGIVMVNNEDIFIEKIIRNILDFCDHLIITDNFSSDNTNKILVKLADENKKIEYLQIESLSISHDLIKKYAGTNIWIFGVDGDEIYDPKGLAQFRKDILDGKYNEWWQIFGAVLNCVSIDFDTQMAEGYLAPPCRSMTKIYNFAAIESWDGDCPERLHGGNIVFKSGFGFSKRLSLHEQAPWSDSPFKCLHTCFLPRSSIDCGKKKWRKNPAELLSEGTLEKYGLGFVRSLRRTKYKKEKYMRGDLTKIDISEFLSENESQY